MYPSAIVSVAAATTTLLAMTTLLPTTTQAMALANKQVSVSQLLQTHKDDITRLKELTAKRTSLEAIPYSNDVFYLRYCLDHAEDPVAQQEQLATALDWRLGPGKDLCESAAAAVTAATNNNNKVWNNDAVLSAAPHHTTIAQYITPSNIITTTTSQDDLVYCIRAGQINDRQLMSAVTTDQMIDFFLFCKEVHCLVVNQRSATADRLLAVLTANDLTGVQLVGGSADFRNALSASSRQAAAVYPASTAGPTLLLNLPTVLSALVKLFTPLFPAVVKERLRFAQGPLRSVADLTQVATAESVERMQFLRELDEMVYASSSASSSA